MPAALLLAQAATAIAPPVMSVRGLERRHEALAGTIVRVRGRLGECQPLSCGLLDDGPAAVPIPWLSFGAAPAFDRAAQPFVGHEVTVDVLVTAECWPDRREGPPCLDRAAQVRPIRLVDAAREAGS